MNSREEILKRVQQAQPGLIPLPEPLPLRQEKGSVEQFSQMLESIGGTVVLLKDSTLEQKIKETFPDAKRIVSSIDSLKVFFLEDHAAIQHHSLEDVDLAIVQAQFGVAENGAVWVTEEDIRIRVLPFISEQLAVILDADCIVPAMQEAYDRIGYDPYAFGVFIAGPSKTADIEQSLVLGAHGPKGMTVFIKETTK